MELEERLPKGACDLAERLDVAMDDVEFAENQMRSDEGVVA